MAFGDIPANSSGQIPGTNTNDIAASGNVGEEAHSNLDSSLSVALTNGVTANVRSLSLDPGDWDVDGIVSFKFTSATQSGDSKGAISTVSATLPANDFATGHDNSRLTTTTCMKSVPIPTQRYSVNAITSIYLVAQANFSAGSAAAFGSLRYRRVR